LWKHYFHLSWQIQQIYEEGATSEDVFDYLFDLGTRKFLSKKGKKYLHELFEKWDPEHLENDEDFNDGLKDNTRGEGMQNLEDY